ncbi:MOSC domain-containing protein [Streptomyces halobius]|uniref:MOSC domain-containing protein n=1 Tax=Streptomyces halobius TaxID=2879846 RepID=A0ABY4MBF4_9ACTN|nr:MOSC domain-containing protein [Streptomyces halobius]UQA94743.1 MOSC domain-containing protein [Streptomyces halobius]
MRLLTVNLGRPMPSALTPAEGGTGIDKRPVDGSVAVAAPGPRGIGASGLAGDAVQDVRHHGGDDQAVYAYAREDLDFWQRELGRALPNGVFGENLTTCGVDVNNARIGERWQIGPRLLLEVTSPRIPCRLFQSWLDEDDWIKRFTAAGMPGAYLRVLEPGEIRAGDAIELAHRPDHEVSVALAFRALTVERELLPRLLEAGDALHPEERARAAKYVAQHDS